MFKKSLLLSLVSTAAALMMITAAVVLFSLQPSFAAEADPGSASDDPGSQAKNDNAVDNATAVWFGVQGDSVGTITFLKNKKGERYEYRALAKQKMYGYDTFQGSCRYGKYAFSVLYNRKNQKCKIIKIRLKDLSVVKVSKPLKLNHGNDITYDTKHKRLLAIHYTGSPKRISIISSKTLKIKKHRDIEIPSELPGASKKFVSKEIKAFTSIGYDAENDEYLVGISKTRHYIVLGPTLKPRRILKVPKISDHTNQGMEVMHGFILRSRSYASKKDNQNVIDIFDLNGNYVKRLSLGTGYEIEDIFFRGKKLYATTYRAYYKAKYKNKKKKTGKYYVLRRDNNIMLITNY